MFNKPNTDPNKKSRLLGELGDPKVNSKATYPKGAKIFGEAEPADYIYQVVKGAVRSHRLLSAEARRPRRNR